MNSLFLSPRSDLFRFSLPKEFIPKEIHEKWYKLINSEEKNFFREPIDILNECIQSISISGINDSTAEQMGTEWNSDTGRIEANHPRVYRSAGNPLSYINNEFTITFRHTQGFYSYFLLFETWFYHHSKKQRKDSIDFFTIEILGEDGRVLSHLVLQWPVYASISDLDLSYNKIDRSSDTFTCTFKFSDIDFDFGPKENKF